MSVPFEPSGISYQLFFTAKAPRSAKVAKVFIV